MGRILHNRGNKDSFLALVRLLHKGEITSGKAKKILGMTESSWRSTLTVASFFFPIYEKEGSSGKGSDIIYGMLPINDFEKKLKYVFRH